MKVTLHDPPEGFEAEAECRWARDGEFIYSIAKNCVVKVGQIVDRDTTNRAIVLTPKKRKYWRLDPVATFSEATKVGTGYSWAYAILDDSHTVGSAYEGNSVKHWLKLTECEE